MTHAAGAGFLPVTPVTHGPKHHFFGYYDKCPWDQTGRYLLASEINFVHRQPEPGEPVTVGMVDLKEQNRYVPLDSTIAWGWQQGTMLQWLGSAPDREIIYNGFDDGKYFSVIRDIHDGKTRRLPLPVYAISPDGKQAVSLDFDRVNRLRPGYGYMAMPERHPDEAAPADAGIAINRKIKQRIAAIAPTVRPARRITGSTTCSSTPRQHGSCFFTAGVYPTRSKPRELDYIRAIPTAVTSGYCPKQAWSRTLTGVTTIPFWRGLA